MVYSWTLERRREEQNLKEIAELPWIAPEVYQDDLDLRQLNRSLFYQFATAGKDGLESEVFLQMGGVKEL
jgi:SpoVK/Ycf46/Vps4 family AAA+-type ATPase